MLRQLFIGNRWVMFAGLFMLATMCCARPGRTQNSGNDPVNPPLTAHLSGIPFALALQVLCKTAEVTCPLPADVAARINPNETYNVDITNGTFQGALNYLLDQVDPLLAYHVDNGAYVLELSKTPRVGKARKKPRMLSPHTYAVNDKTFDEAVCQLFRNTSVPVRFRIDPAVTAFLDPINFTVDSAEEPTFDQKLTDLLNAVPGQKTPLAYHVEKGVYVITPKSVAGKASADIAAVGLPSYHPSPSLKDVSFVNTPLDAGLRLMFAHSGVNYLFRQQNNVIGTPRVTFAMHDVPLEQAVVRLLRSAPADPPLYLRLWPTSDTEPTRLYVVAPDRYAEESAAAAPNYHYSFAFHRINLYDALNTMLQGTRQDYILDQKLQEIILSASGSDLSTEQALNKLLAASPRPLKTSIKDNAFRVEVK